MYFVRYCKYDILQGKMSKSVEISRLHKDLKKMWIGELIGRKFSTFKNMKKCWKIKLCTKLSTLSTSKRYWLLQNQNIIEYSRKILQLKPKTIKCLTKKYRITNAVGNRESIPGAEQLIFILSTMLQRSLRYLEFQWSKLWE